MEVMARYSGGADAAWKMGRIMLKYRPIAPKPITGAGAVTVGSVDVKSNGSGRRKRKGCLRAEAVRRGRKKRGKKEAVGVYSLEDTEAKTANDDNSNGFILSPIEVVTLPLMPETQESATANDEDDDSSSGGANIVTPHPVWPTGSWVTVDSVTGTWRDGEFPLPTLEPDTSPSFVSDACDRVTWTNAAYRRMVVGPSTGGEEEEVRVTLATRGTVPQDPDTCFTCRARVRHVYREGRKAVSMVVPCDVWRLGDGRLAWRLDVKAALSLSLIGV